MIPRQHRSLVEEEASMFAAMTTERPSTTTAARQIRVREETRRILVDFREAQRDRRRPEFKRARPVRVWR
jgi:Ribonuclease G/E